MATSLGAGYTGVYLRSARRLKAVRTTSAINLRLWRRNSSYDISVQPAGSACQRICSARSSSRRPLVASCSGQYAEGGLSAMARLSFQSTNAMLAIWLIWRVPTIPSLRKYARGNRWCRSIPFFAVIAGSSCLTAPAAVLRGLM